MREGEKKIFDFKFDWSSDININLGDIDEKHKQMFRTGRDIEQLLRIQCMGVDEEQIIDTVSTLRESLLLSFCEEEQFMWRYAYSDFEAHRKIHTRFAEELAQITCADLKENPIEKLENLKKVLTAWTLEHMLTEDGKMAIEIRGKLNE